MKRALSYLLLVFFGWLSVEAGSGGNEVSGIVDPAITALNYTNRASGAYTSQEPVIIDFTNNGSEPIVSIDLYFRVNNSEEVVETYIPETPVPNGRTVSYTFRQKADLGLFGTSIELRAGVRMAGDENLNNNEIKVTLNNIATGIPYYPDFVYDEGGVVMVDPIGWKTSKKGGDAYWEITDEEWQVDPSKSTADADCYLMTIPVWMTTGKTYDLKFDAYTDVQTGSSGQLNKLCVYITTDSKIETDMNLVWENNAVGQVNAKNTFVRYTPSKNGMYYFAFHCKSPKTADKLRLQNIYMREVFGKDAGVIAITAPADNPYLYTAQEKVSVLVHNFGSIPVAANQLKLNLQINGKSPVSETITTPMDANSTLSYTFKAFADLSEIGLIHRIKVWTTFEGDQDQLNDTTSCYRESLVTAVPYKPNFGTVRQKSPETDRWTVDDKNQDDFMFIPVTEVELDSYVFGHGGWRVGSTTITVPKSDDELISRPIRLESGMQYKLSYLTRIEKADSRVPLIVNLYKVTDGQRVFVKEIWTGDVTSVSYQEKEHKVDIDATGIYEFGFLVRYAEPLSFMIRLGRFQLTRVYDVNLTLEKILIPSTGISCYNSYPVGAVVRNNGKNTITSFTLKAASAASGTVEKKVTGLSLASGDSYTTYFDSNLRFEGTESEYFKLSALADGDLYEIDNRDSLLISYVAPSEIPYMGNLLYFRPEGWTAINNNRDEAAFEFTQGKGFVYDTKGEDIQGNDLLISNCFSLKKDKIYTLDFNFSINKGDTTSFETFLLNGNEQIPVVKVNSVPGTTGLKRTFKGYIAVPEDGNYPVCLQINDRSGSLIFNGKFNLSEAAGRPDIKLMEITVPSKDTVFTKNETVRATFKNVGQRDLTYVPFTCKVGGKAYYSGYLTTVSVNDNIYTVEFKGVDLNTPGSYDVEISADVSQDAVPENNVLTKTIRSLPVPDVAVIGLESPESGVLTKEEKVIVSVKNEGKGVLTDIPVRCTVTAEGSDFRKELSGVIPGPLADGETVHFTFDETIDLYEEGHYIFNLSAELAGDIREENNSKEVSVLSSHKELDAGVSAVISPTDNLLGVAETVSIQVKNYCEANMYEVPVTAEITYLSGEASVPQILAGKVATIKAGEAIEYTFDKTADMKAVGEYSVKAYTTVKNDVNPGNDVCEKKVKSYRTDVGVAEIISPESGEELGLREVIIRVKNYGESTVGQIPVAYKVGTMPQLGLVTETIAPGESCTYTFPSSYDFSSYKTYTITAYTELENDLDVSNNTCSKEIENKPSGIDSESRNEISLYPNPSKGSFCISQGEAVLQSVMICNMEGVVLLRYDGADAAAKRFDTPLAEGNYLVKIVTSTGMLNLKLVIVK